MHKTLESVFESCGAPERDRRNQRRVTVWSLIWILGWTAVMVATKREWITDWAVGALTAATLVPAIVMVIVYRRYLREADELRRKIELDALALAFGVGVIGGITFYPLAIGGLVEMADSLYVVLAMTVTYSAGVVIGHRRYS